MFEHLDPTTVFLCRFIIMLIWGSAMVVALFSNRNEKAPRYWLAGIVCLIVADAQHATGFVGEELYGRRIQFVLYSALFVFTWLGFRSFVGKAAPLAKSLGPILAFVLFILASDGMTSDMLVKYRLDAAINAAFGTAFCAAIVATLMSDRLTRQLPMAWLAAFVYMLGVVSMSMDFWIVVFEPLHVQDNLVMSETRIVNSLQNFILVSISAVSTILLLKERSEQRYRIASETDSLTGIANRRAFVSNTEKQLAKAGPSSTMAVIDLDHFKAVNDKHGHQAGDEVLVAFTRFVKATLPKDACFGRLGGEEFGVFLPENGTDSYEVLDALRRETETLTITYQAVRIPITISIGAASIATAGACFDTLAAAADRALYIAKDNGRNQVSIFTPAQGIQTILDKAQEMSGDLAGSRISRPV